MPNASSDLDWLLREQRVLLQQYGGVQRRCEALLAAHRELFARLEADALRLRAALIARDTALAWADEDRAALEQATVPLDVREKAVLCIGRDAPGARTTRRLVERAGGHFVQYDASGNAEDEDDAALLDASLRAADLVICQTGCVSHDAYWRVQDHCRRTGKRCVLIDAPQPLRFMARLPAAQAD